MKSSRLASAVVASLVAVALSSCVATPGPSAAPTSASTTPAPTATYVQPASPEPRLAVGCMDIGALPSLASAIGATPSVGDISGNVNGGDIGSIGELGYLPIFQAGGFDCMWESTSGADYTSASVVLLPGGDSGWAALPASADQPATTGWADGARVGCFSQEGFNCRYDVLVGTTWLQIATYTTGAASGFPAVSDALAHDIVAAVKAAGEPAPLWVAPASAFPADCAALGSHGTPDPKLLIPMSPIQAEAMRLVGAYQCAWSGEGGHGVVEAFGVPGGAWGWTSHPAFSNQSITLSSLGGLGDGAVAGCSSVVNDCIVHTIANGGWLSLWVGGPGATADGAAATARQMLSLG